MFRASQEVGPYTLIEKLGRGGFGEVWLAEKRSELVTKKVAVKLPHEDQIDLEAIKQEAALWEQASGHPNVLPIIDAEIYEGQVVIVSEYADGGSLHQKLIDEGKFPLERAVELAIGVLTGLEFLHNRRIIHRDVKPQNILLQGDSPRLADFGISRAMQTTAVSSAVVGTDAYMAPEAFEGKRTVQTDIWSVGVVLYQLLLGTLPFPQQHPSERMFAILQHDFDPLPVEIPERVRQIVSRALAKKAEHRYTEASVMREDLVHFLHGVSKPTPTNEQTLVLSADDSKPVRPVEPVSEATVVKHGNTGDEDSASVSSDQSVATRIKVPLGDDASNRAESPEGSESSRINVPLESYDSSQEQNDDPSSTISKKVVMLIMVVPILAFFVFPALLGLTVGVGAGFIWSDNDSPEDASTSGEKSSEPTVIREPNDEMPGDRADRQANDNPDDAEPETPTPTPTPTPVLTGVISGRLTYPSDGIPSNMNVCVTSVRGGKSACSNRRVSGFRFSVNRGSARYSVTLPAGTYYIYGTLPGQDRAYYTEYIRCGMDARCTSHARIPIKVTAGQTRSGITVGDWWDF